MNRRTFLQLPSGLLAANSFHPGAPLHAGQEAPQADEWYIHAKPEVVERWKDMRYGMFLCWGPVSLTGKEIGWSRGAPPWGRREGMRGGTGPTPYDVYDNLYKKWKPDQYDAEAWVKLAKENGMQYLIFLTKHHDGFCLYDSKLTDYKSTGPESAWKVDVLKDVADACHKHDLKLIVYYSQPDWHHPDFLGDNHQNYIKYLHGQLREILTNYGKIDGIWFDDLRRHGHVASQKKGQSGDIPEGIKLWDAKALFKMMRTLQPDLIINNRCGLLGDYDTPENRVGFFNNKRPWETCITITHQWSWKPNDVLRSYRECLYLLVNSAIGDGNLALNTGPMPDGRIEPRQAERYRDLGRWMKKYGESITGTRGGPFLAPDQMTRTQKKTYEEFKIPVGRWWGGSTHKGNTVYLHILRWPSDTIVLPPIERKIVRSSVLTGGTVKLAQNAEQINISVPVAERDALDTIVKLELDGPAKDIATMYP